MYVRKNAATLTDDEWRRLMLAFVTLKHTTPPGSNVSIYDSFVAMHQAVTSLSGAQNGDGAHGNAWFLPWHREYLRRLEMALQSVDASVSLPYWNWGLGPLSDTTLLFTDQRMGPMGAPGPANAFEVTSGYLAQAGNAFNPLGWTIHAALRPFGAGLQRNQTLDTGSGWPTESSVRSALGATSYGEFRSTIERSPNHNRVHVRVGRDMARMTSPNDPIFWLHHCQVDRIWALWQEDHPGTANIPSSIASMAMWPWDAGASSSSAPAAVLALLPGLPSIDVVTAADVVDHRALGYCYEGQEDCPCPDAARPTVPRLEAVPTVLRAENMPPPTTLARFEEDPPTTLRFGEEGPSPTTAPTFEEDPPTTLRLGEEGGPTTFAQGEEGPGPITLREDGPPGGGFGGIFGGF